MLMDMEKVASRQDPSSCRKKKKSKKHKNDMNSKANHNCVQEGFLVKDMPLVPAVVEAATIELPATEPLVKDERKKKRRKKSDNLEMYTENPENTLLVTAQADTINLDPSADVTSKKKKRNKGNNSDTDETTALGTVRTLLVPKKTEGASLEHVLSVTSGKTKTKISNDVEMETLDDNGTSFDPIKSEDTSLALTADVSSRNKNKKKKSARAHDVNTTTINNESASSKFDVTRFESAADVTSEKKKRKKKKAERGGNDETATAVHNECTLLVSTKAEDTGIEPGADDTSRDEERKKETNGRNDVETGISGNDSTVMVLTNTDATNLDPIADVTLGKKMRKKRKGKAQSGDTERSTVENEEDTGIERAADGTSRDGERKKTTSGGNDVGIAIVDNDSTALIPINIDAANLDPISDVTSVHKKRKKKKERTQSGDIERSTVEDTSMKPAADRTSRDGERKKKTGGGNDVGTAIVDNDSTTLIPINTDATNLDPIFDVTSGQKKRKKRKEKTQSSDIERSTVDNEEDTSIELAADGTSRDGERKKTTSGGNDIGIAIVDNDSTTTIPMNTDVTKLDPIADVTSGEKKKKKETQSGHSEITTVDNQSSLSVPTNAEGTGLQPAADATSRKKKRKREKAVKTVENLKMTMVDNDRTLLENNDIQEHKGLDSEVNIDQTMHPEKLISESLVNTESQVSQDSVTTLGNKRRKETSKSQNPDTDHENQNDTAVEPVATGRDNPCKYSVDTNGMTSVKPTPITDSSCPNKKKRKRKKAKVQGIVDNASEGKVGKSQDAVTGNVVLDKMDSEQGSQSSIGVKLGPENSHAESSLLLIDNQYKALDGCEIDCGLHQNIGNCRRGVASANDSGKDIINMVRESAGMNPTGMKENSLTVEAQIGLSNGVNNSFRNSCDPISEAGRSHKSKEIITYQRKKNNNIMEVRKSSDEVDGVSKQVVDLSAEKESANCPGLDLDVISKAENVPQPPIILPERTLVPVSRKKLLILDVNGILVDFVEKNPEKLKADIRISQKDVFKRPYCDEFLKFCFEKFTVGVWSSRLKRNMEKVIDFLFGDSQKNLLFIWDQSHCTMTGFNTVENSRKPLVLKELRKIWDKVEPDLPFEKGDYDETNTLLLDDSPYKALLNPANTAIFPKPFEFTNSEDNFLGPEGDLRAYLEGIVLADNVQSYVQKHRFGQPAISSAHVSWGFYRRILQVMKKPSKL